jgi:hypothetical protein
MFPVTTSLKKLSISNLVKELILTITVSPSL